MTIKIRLKKYIFESVLRQIEDDLSTIEVHTGTFIAALLPTTYTRFRPRVTKD